MSLVNLSTSKISGCNKVQRYLKKLEKYTNGKVVREGPLEKWLGRGGENYRKKHRAKKKWRKENSAEWIALLSLQTVPTWRAP